MQIIKIYLVSASVSNFECLYFCVPFRSRFLAPMVVCVVTLVSILTVWRLLVSLDMCTLCQWLSLRGLLELPLMRCAPFPKSEM